ncbi:hypothetical protein IW261DRAFT_496935 [Armillaria novae-zelandiae]|uniref:Secreted protein n=1 Tax=Armillaria novae-zelandiae TaxID=153914 RepID=A0AA39KGD3_9AGAR|nr:hypothetical protein IW261DRAFT_496935 [Armillaria novae-zelandiae]
MPHCFSKWCAAMLHCCSVLMFCSVLCMSQFCCSYYPLSLWMAACLTRCLHFVGFVPSEACLSAAASFLVTSVLQHCVSSVLAFGFGRPRSAIALLVRAYEYMFNTTFYTKPSRVANPEMYATVRSKRYRPRRMACHVRSMDLAGTLRQYVHTHLRFK